ncbi:putative ribosomal RNA-processing protein 7 homolog B [Chlorocebus sabaeus]|uniref:putative ribosomal RNA-processing protein 7 homolog B n=1 Tax=Chlorocebus sabaeus TaxID=60711 RepID=UPI003BFA2C59
MARFLLQLIGAMRRSKTGSASEELFRHPPPSEAPQGRPSTISPVWLWEAKAKEEEEGVPDEEGWVKVTRRGRRPVLPRTEAASLRVLERERRKRARKELLNFYAWQHRESKMEHLAQLRKKFQEDKQKIELGWAQRKF